MLWVLEARNTILFVITKVQVSHHDDAFPGHVLLTEITNKSGHRALIILDNQDGWSIRTNGINAQRK